MKNIVFDLGGVLCARDKNKSTQEFHEFFSFIRSERMPLFWEEYDRGASTLGEVTDMLARTTGCPREKCERFLLLSIDMQEPVAPTERLVGDLKAAGYRLYVLSNMSREFIAFLRRFPVYRLFDGEVVSCEEGTVKPDRGFTKSCWNATDSIPPKPSSSTTARRISPPPKGWASPDTFSTTGIPPPHAASCGAGCCNAGRR